MSGGEHSAWQRDTALRKVEALRVQAASDGVAMPERAMAQKAGVAVGVSADQVQRWMRGAE